MMPAPARGPDYEARIRRAEHLASKYPFAAEVLAFYQQLANFQKCFYAKLACDLASRSAIRAEGQLRSESDLNILLPHVPELLTVLQRTGTAPIKGAARKFAERTSSEQIALLNRFWAFGGASNPEQAQNVSPEPLDDFILHAFVQPYAEFLAGKMPDRALEATYRVCPRCGSPPLLGVLRPEGDGAKRFLMCSFCLREWEFRRIFCPACAEDTEGKLPVYVAEQFPHIRVESCDTCKSFLRTVDLTKDGHAVPVVDDLSAIPLSLWAHQHGYTRLHENLLGT